MLAKKHQELLFLFFFFYSSFLTDVLCGWFLIGIMVFPVVTYRCESRTIKKAEHQRIDGFKL